MRMTCTTAFFATIAATAFAGCSHPTNEMASTTAAQSDETSASDTSTTLVSAETLTSTETSTDDASDGEQTSSNDTSVEDSSLLETLSSQSSSETSTDSTDVSTGDTSSDTDSETMTQDMFRCTQVIGFSQVGQAGGGWYVAGNAFESTVVDGAWQLLWANGAGVDLWQDADFSGWSEAMVSPCDEADASVAPDRVLLSVSGPYGSDVPGWVTAIEATLDTIGSKIPSARQAILQAAVGGPDHELCQFGGQAVRAAAQHPSIDAAIDMVVARRRRHQLELVAGISPELSDCSGYSDSLGHLQPDAAAQVGETIGLYYRSERFGER